MRKLFVAAFGIAFVLGAAHAEVKADDVVGHWYTDGEDSKIEIAKEGEKFSGKLIWLKEPNQGANDPEPGKPKRDAKNPDAAHQKDTIVGLALLKDFTWDGSGAWSGGTIYDPESGKTYKATMKLTDEKTLDVRGYIGIPAFGRSTVWKRVDPEAEKKAAAATAPDAGSAKDKKSE